MRPRRPRWGVLLAGLAGALAVAEAAGRAWVCDDAFISFRYARNLARGLGLVFNPGERVEGYTNFAWTLLAAAAHAAGLDPVPVTELAGLASYAAAIALLAVAAARVARDHGRPRPLVLFAPLGLAAMHHARVWATGGLETMTLVALAAAIALAAVARRAATVGLLGALATTCHPDAGLLLLAGALASGRPARALAVAAVPLGAWTAWRLAWYGDLLPNTFHAKAGAGLAQGAFYAGSFLLVYWPLAAGPVAAALSARTPRGPGWAGRPAALLLAGGTLAWLAWVVAVGGDFMFARFVLPAVPLLLLGVEVGLARLPRHREPLAALLVLALLLSPRPAALDSTRHPEGWHGVIDEDTWYPPERVAEARRWGERLRPLLAGTGARVVFYGGQAMLVYYADVPWALEGHVGLTDREVARLPRPEGARPGHGQRTTLDYLRRREVDLSFDFRLQQPRPPLARVDFGEGVTARAITWRPEVMRALAARGVRVVDFPAFLDAYVAALPDRDPEIVTREYASFRSYYFDHADDDAHAEAIERYLRARGVEPP